LSKKEKFALYLTPEKKAVLERRYREDGSRSLTAFIERAVDFYLDYLSANDAGLFLPTALKSYVDGRLGQMEDRMSSLLYKQAVEQDLVRHGEVESRARTGVYPHVFDRDVAGRHVDAGADAQDVLFVVLRRNGICQQDGGHDKQYFFHNEWVWVCIRGKYRIIFSKNPPPRNFLRIMKKISVNAFALAG